MNALLETLHSHALARIAEALLHFLWQGAAVAALLACGLVALRRHSARTRYALSCAALLVMAMLPLVTLAWGGSDPEPVSQAGLAASPGRPGMSVADPGLPAAGIPWLPWVTLVWLAGVTALAARILGGWLRVRRLRAVGTRPVLDPWPARLAELQDRLGFRGAVRLLESGLVRVPMVLGWLRPVILLPTGFVAGMPPAQVDAILAHELAHLCRRDYLVNLLQCGVETLLFYHPAIWWVSGRIRIEREYCCDDLAAQALGDRMQLAHALVTLAERGFPAPALALAADGGSLSGRVRRLVGFSEPGIPGAWGRRVWWSVILTVVVAGVVWLVPRLTAPRLYVATSRIRVENLANDPYRMMTVAETLRSMSVLAPMAERAGLAEKWKVGDPVALMERLRDRVRVRQYRNTEILEVSVASEDRGDAAEMANTIVQLFRQRALDTEAEGANRARELLRSKMMDCERHVEKLDAEYRNWLREARQAGESVDPENNLRWDALKVYRDVLSRLRTQVVESELEPVKASRSVASVEVIDAAIPPLRPVAWRN